MIYQKLTTGTGQCLLLIRKHPDGHMPSQRAQGIRYL